MLEGLITLPWWGYIIAALILTHITIAAVTIYLHRHQAHRALDLHPIVSHFFRFWLWLTTGMVTKEWAAIHRKHHAKVETPDDPHSPQQFGIRKVMWQGAELYRKESKNLETMEKYGHGTPDDWIERNLYSRHSAKGIGLMFAINVALFGPIGITIWATQMIWIPIFAAGIINGVGHYWGYRNYEVSDASTNIVPWGILIGGEELHNNHHTFGSSAKFSSKWWEFDIGWMYINIMKALGLARVKKIPPALTCDTAKEHMDIETVKAVITARFLVMSQFAREVMQNVHREELKKADRSDRDSWALLKRARRLMVREAALLDETSHRWLNDALENNGTLRTVYMMKQKLQDIWQRSASTQEHLLRALQEWCREAEATGIQALQDFSQKLRTYTLVPVTA
ncbi:MAG: fatty acid desaturase [Sulfuricaulis sp.]|uniref:DesA family fatty acid desaturase n=1 Tax=Sulfuricaulis sp. TaxID=2003553 RepID=UPI0025DEE30E|nr:fatty acid desaturase [Sulfuricaulis sp.]MCR4347614.1 fatty acid desaturase [Sulfuricaulis sp.]